MKNNIFINRYVMACAIAIVITLVGVICMSTLPIEQYPNIAPPTVRVSTSYTGADANTIMKAVADLGWFQAPGNLAFAILGLLYGEGDFGKSVAFAVNCGDDADCTGGFVGALAGIILGKSGIPRRWTRGTRCLRSRRAGRCTA